MAEMQKIKNMIVYRKQITTDEPDAHAEAVLEFEGIPEERTAEIREKFNRFFEDIEQIVKKETSPAE